MPHMEKEFALTYAMDGSAGEGKGVVEAESLAILPALGEPRRIPLREISAITPADYKVTITLAGGILVVSGLGFKYEDFVRELCRARNELAARDMLMEDTLKMGNVRCSYSFASGDNEGKGECEVRVYETSLVILPDSGELARFPFCDVSDMRQEGYSLVLETEYGEKLALSALGRQMDPLKKAIADASGALSLKAQELLMQAAPDAGAEALAKAARLMRDGKAAGRAELDKISPAIWAGLRRKFEDAGLKEEYSMLEGASIRERMCMGIKRSLMGQMEGEYMWLLAPLKGRNVIVMEATSPEESGRATYLFRIMPENEFSAKAGEERLQDALRTINRCMIAVNFRREPVYLGQDALNDPKNAAYKFSIARLPELRTLRSLFIGRAVHNEVWAKNVLGQ